MFFLFTQTSDEWLDAVIAARHAVQVLNTTVEIVTFDVQYILPSSSGADAEGEMKLEKGVKPDRLRILSNSAGEVLHLDGLAPTSEEDTAEGVKVEETEAAAPAPLDDNTGK